MLLVLSVVTAVVLLVTPFVTAIWALHVIFGASYALDKPHAFAANDVNFSPCIHTRYLSANLGIVAWTETGLVGFTAAALDTGVLVLTCAVQGTRSLFMSIYAEHPLHVCVHVNISVCAYTYHGLVWFRVATAATEMCDCDLICHTLNLFPLPNDL